MELIVNVICIAVSQDRRKQFIKNNFKRKNEKLLTINQQTKINKIILASTFFCKDFVKL